MGVLEKLLLDAGYYHIKASSVSGDANSVNLSYIPNMAYLIQLDEKQPLVEDVTDLLKKNGVCVNISGNENQKYILYRPQKDSVEVNLKSRNTVQKLSFAPTQTEISTLEYGLRHFGRELTNVAIMVDDLGLPRGIANHLDVLLPESYQASLAEKGFTKPLVISERISRNRGVQAARKQKAKFLKEQRQTGNGILKLEMTDATERRDVLTSDFLRNHPWASKGCTGLVGVVGLTRPDKTGKNDVPSCGVIGAGYLNEIIAAGYNGPIISIYNLIDDPDIGRKLFDGAVITAWLKPETDLPITTILLSGGLKRPATEYMRDEWTLGALRTGIEPDKGMER